MLLQFDAVPFADLFSQFGAIAAFIWLAREYRVTRESHREERQQWQDSVTELTRQIHDLRHEVEALSIRTDGGDDVDDDR